MFNNYNITKYHAAYTNTGECLISKAKYIAHNAIIRDRRKLSKPTVRRVLYIVSYNIRNAPLLQLMYF